MLSSEFVASYFEAWNDRDAGGVADHLALDGSYFDMPIGQQLSRDALVEHLQEFFLRDNNVYDLVGEVLTGKTSIAFQYRATPLDPERAGESWMGAEFITMEGDAAGKIEDYYPANEHAAEQGDRSAAVRRVAVQRYAKSGLGSSQLRQVMDKLSEKMHSERLYLSPDLTLPALAENLGCSVNHLSQAINAGFGMGFFDFVNQFRVKEATSLLCEEGSESDAILNIALAVGFNSTSTFYAAFKKSTGQTPAQYRKSQRAGR